jgi:hypothetical protein
MSQKLLNRAEICASPEEVRREAVPQAVRADRLGRRRLADPLGNQHSHTPICQSPADVIDEQRIVARPATGTRRKV